MNEQNNNEMNSQQTQNSEVNSIQTQVVQPQIQNIETNYAQQTVANAEAKPPKKRSGLFTLFACIMTAIIVVLAMNLGQKIAKTVEPDTKSSTKVEDKDEKTVEENSDSTEEKQEEVKEITDLTEETKKAIATKFATLVGDNDYTYGDLIKAGAYGDLFIPNLIENKLTEEDKTYLILLGVKQDANGNYSAKYFEEKYKYVYGTQPQFVNLECPPLVYNKNTNQYTSGDGGCGGAWSISHNFYIDEIIKTNDSTITIKAYVGSLESTPEQEKYYSDYYKTDGNGNATATVTKETTITDANKTSFAKYAINFEKAADGNYYYKSTAKAS